MNDWGDKRSHCTDGLPRGPVQQLIKHKKKEDLSQNGKASWGSDNILKEKIRCKHE